CPTRLQPGARPVGGRARGARLGVGVGGSLGRLLLWWWGGVRFGLVGHGVIAPAIPAGSCCGACLPARSAAWRLPAPCGPSCARTAARTAAAPALHRVRP